MKKILSLMSLAVVTNATAGISLINTSNIEKNSLIKNSSFNSIKNQNINSKVNKFADEVVITDNVHSYKIIKINITADIAYKLQDRKISIKQYVEKLHYYDGSHTEIPIFWWQYQLSQEIESEIYYYQDKLKDYATDDGLFIKLRVLLSSDHVASFTDMGIYGYVSYNPFSSLNNYDQVEKYYKFLAHDILKVGISTNAWNWIKSLKQVTMSNLTGLFNNFPKYDKSGAGGEIEASDINALATAVFTKYESLNDHFLSYKNIGVKLVINTAGYFFNIENE